MKVFSGGLTQAGESCRISFEDSLLDQLAAGTLANAEGRGGRFSPSGLTFSGFPLHRQSTPRNPTLIAALQTWKCRYRIRVFQTIADVIPVSLSVTHSFMIVVLFFLGLLVFELLTGAVRISAKRAEP